MYAVTIDFVVKERRDVWRKCGNNVETRCIASLQGFHVSNESISYIKTLKPKLS